MSSVYFPAHVVVLFRRIVNVVSTLSISNQYVLHSRERPDEYPKRTLPIVINCLRNVEWPQWMYVSHWNRGFSQRPRQGRVTWNAISPESVLKGNWSWPNNLFSSYQPELNLPPHDSDPPPNKDPKRTSSQKKHSKPHKLPAKERYEPSNQDGRTTPPDTIHQLLVNPALYDPIRTPRFPIVLCHGLYGFDSRGPSSFPSMRMHYWSNVLNILRGKVGAEVIVTSVPGTGSISARADRLDEQLRLRARGRGINFLAHSMGGLDCRHLISHIQPREYVPLSLTSISTPHRGSPFMDWCADNIGIGKLRQREKETAELLKRRTQRDIEEFSADIAEEDSYARPNSAPESSPKPKTKSSSESAFSLSLSSLPSSFITLLLSVVDSPAYANLRSSYLDDVFNPATPDDPSVKYWSVAGRMSAKSVSVWHPFWLPKMVLDGVEEKERDKLKKIWEEENAGGAHGWGKDIPFWANEREWGNDGLVTVQSAKWGEFLGIVEGADHWEMRGARGIEFGVDLPALPAIGLGSVPLLSHKPMQTSQGDGWGFGDWTRFVGAWKKSKIDAEKVEGSAGTVADGNPRNTKTNNGQDEIIGVVSASSSTPASARDPPKREKQSEKRKREREQDDHVVKSSTDTLSFVFDWLIERVPGPSQILGVTGGAKATAKGKGKENGEAKIQAEARVTGGAGKAAESDKELGAAAVRYSVAMSPSQPQSSSASSSTNKSSPPSQQPPSEIKKRMDKEGKGRQQNELASKADLERFYIALSRKMYDEGL
ncbi:Alpha/Beta hydrolase protein [Gymnopilus junonius]|uniref:Alpha/Beta hydrolase protein n=1 Tax=Gymnopilus junonius TaxID=109634 RepID=A0A9P5NRP7_GYMJU|nr:Alpha/Beta hydrolase protein [Gymnopilus junonius]